MAGSKTKTRIQRNQLKNSGSAWNLATPNHPVAILSHPNHRSGGSRSFQNISKILICLCLGGSLNFIFSKVVDQIHYLHFGLLLWGISGIVTVRWKFAHIKGKYWCWQMFPKIGVSLAPPPPPEESLPRLTWPTRYLIHPHHQLPASGHLIG